MSKKSGLNQECERPSDTPAVGSCIAYLGCGNAGATHRNFQVSWAAFLALAAQSSFVPNG